MLAIYAGFDADHAYYAYAYLREDFYKSSGARAAHAGNLTVTLGKNVKGKGKLDAEKYVSRGRCDDFDYDLCAVAFTSDALGEPVDALKTTKFDCTTTHWFRSSVKYKTPRWTTPYAMPADVAAGVGYTIAAPLFDAEGKLRGAAGADVGLSRVSEIIAATARTWWREDLGAYDPKGLFFYVVDADLRVVASSVGPRVAPADDLFHYAPNSSNALVANGSAAYVAGVVAGDLRVVNGTFTYVSALDFAIGGLEWYLVTAYDADCPAGYEVRGLGCDPCEDARDSLAGSPVCDRCVPGFYLRAGDCASCPDNGVCLGGLDAPYPRKGYWGDAGSPHEFYECEPGHCRKKFRCRPGYTGRLCSRLESVAATRGAADRYFTISSSLPFKCPQTTRNRWLLTGSSILAVVLGWLYVNNVLLNVYAPLGMLVYSVQHMAIIARYQIDFPVEFIQKYSLFLDFMLFDVDVFKPSCVITWTPWRSHVTQMLVCALGLLRFVPVTTRVAHKFATDRAYRRFGAVVASLRYEGEFGPQIARGVTEFLSLLDVQHTTIAFNSLQAIRCDEINGAWYMREDPQGDGRAGDNVDGLGDGLEAEADVREGEIPAKNGQAVAVPAEAPVLERQQPAARAGAAGRRAEDVELPEGEGRHEGRLREQRLADEALAPTQVELVGRARRREERLLRATDGDAHGAAVPRERAPDAGLRRRDDAEAEDELADERHLEIHGQRAEVEVQAREGVVEADAVRADADEGAEAHDAVRVVAHHVLGARRQRRRRVQARGKIGRQQAPDAPAADAPRRPLAAQARRVEEPHPDAVGHDEAAQGEAAARRQPEEEGPKDDRPSREDEEGEARRRRLLEEGLQRSPPLRRRRGQPAHFVLVFLRETASLPNCTKGAADREAARSLGRRAAARAVAPERRARWRRSAPSRRRRGRRARRASSTRASRPSRRSGAACATPRTSPG